MNQLYIYIYFYISSLLRLPPSLPSFLHSSIYFFVTILSILQEVETPVLSDFQICLSLLMVETPVSKGKTLMMLTKLQLQQYNQTCKKTRNKSMTQLGASQGSYRPVALLGN